MSEASPPPVGPSTPKACTEAFVHAVVWGEHSTLWDLFSPAGRDRVLAAGARGGLDPVKAERIRQGTSPHDEMDSFLTGLVQGLRVDLSSAELGEIEVGPVAPTADGGTEVQLVVPSAFHHEPWVAGVVLLSSHDGRWSVDRLDPRRVRG